MDHSENTAEELPQNGGTSDQGAGNEETPVDPSLNVGAGGFQRCQRLRTAGGADGPRAGNRGSYSRQRGGRRSGVSEGSVSWPALLRRQAPAAG